MLHEDIKCSFSTIPFKSSLSFEYLIKKITEIAKDDEHPMVGSAKEILKKIDLIPEFKVPIIDESFLAQNQSLVNRLMKFVFNPLDDNSVIATAGAPFIPKVVYSTQLFKDTILGDHRRLEATKNLEEKNLLLAVIYQAYLIILIRFYDFNYKIDIPFNYKLIDDQDGSVKYFRLIVNHNYTNVKVKGKIKKLTEKQLKSLFDNTADLDFWNDLIPLEKFEFTGFLHFTYINITHDYVISQLKSDLLDKHAIISQTGFNKIREKVRALVEIPDLEFGMAAFSDFESSINQNVIWKSIIPQSELKCDDYNGTLYETAYRERKIVLTDDLGKIEKNKMVSLFLEKNIRNHAIVPLILDDEIVGMVEFGAKEANRFNMVQIKRLHELFPVFAIALKRSKEELTDRIRAIIQEECTAIHPTVEWRFRDAASKMLNEDKKGESTKMEPIIFVDVVPVYGATDIRNSSVERNYAIQSDLSEHLNLAKEILIKGMVDKEMPLLDHLVYKVDKHLGTVNLGLKAGDEVSILEFLKRDIEPVFKQLSERDTAMADAIALYFSKMDPELKVLYKKRKDFEDSLTQINDIVGEIIDQEQDKAQDVFPHYFEKYRTDGVEYNAYIGQSLVKDLVYDKIYLKNIRLWQLLVKVRVARKIRELMPSLKIQLDVTQLILVHSNPLSIAFRQDEKKFDVAGAYNIRYEITKKRIDKAVIKGTNERVTQVGKIAIIYSHAEEIEEYKKYIDYMIAKGYLKNNIEDFELEDLKGASGLRALRVGVDFGSLPQIDDINISEIKKVIESN